MQSHNQLQLHIKDIKDAMRRLELATGISDTGTIVSQLLEMRFGVSRNNMSAPSPESLWAGDHSMSVLHTQIRTQNDSTDLLVDHAADESVCPSWFCTSRGNASTCGHDTAHSERLISQPFWRDGGITSVTRALGRT